MAEKKHQTRRDEVHNSHDRYLNQEVQYLPSTHSKKDKISMNKDKVSKGNSPIIDKKKSANKNAEQVRKLL